MMFQKFIHFIKYNNLAVFVILAVFLVGGSVFAQTETGQDIIGEKEGRIEGIDNKLLLEADIDKLNMNFKIESIREDDKYYYVTYTFYDLVEVSNAWQYQVIEKTRKVSKKSRKDLGVFLANEFKQQYQDRSRSLKFAKIKAESDGPVEKVEVEEYTGLIGETLTFASKVFTNYEPVKKRVIPTPSVPLLLTTIQKTVDGTEAVILSGPDNLTIVYEDYIIENDPDGDDIFGNDDNCPNDYNPDQEDICNGSDSGSVILADNNEATSTVESEDLLIDATSTEEEIDLHIEEPAVATSTESEPEVVEDDAPAQNEEPQVVEEPVISEEVPAVEPEEPVAEPEPIQEELEVEIVELDS